MIGNNIKKFEVLDSTNDFVKRNIINLQHGCIIVSNSQTDGKGRRNKKWESVSGNLYFSIVLKDDISRKSIFNNIVLTSLSITKTLMMYSIYSDIKYPNDCLVKGRKISGILIESKGSYDLDYIIIGVGLNVNQVEFQNLEGKATSMRQETSKSFNLNKVLETFIGNFNSLLSRDYNEIFKEYLNQSNVIGKNIQYDGQQYTISSIDSKGALIIVNAAHELKIAFNEISLEELY